MVERTKVNLLEARTPLQTGYIPVEGGWVYFEKHLPSEPIGYGKLTLLTIHGGPGFPLDLYPLNHLNRRVVSYHQLGCGKSDKPDDPSLWTIERFVDEAGAVCDSLELDNIVVLGYSWGAIIANEFVAREKRAGKCRIKALILASPAVNVPNYDQDILSLREQLPFIERTILELGDPKSDEYKMAYSTFESYYMAGMDVDRLPEAMKGQEHDIHPQVLETLLSENGDLPNYNGEALLKDLGVPILFTCGGYDEAKGNTLDAQKLTPGSELVVFYNSAHMPQITEPEEYLRTIETFLRRFDRPA